MKTSHSFKNRRAFSLVELLVVIVIMGIIAGFAVPALGPVLRGSGLSQSATMLADQMSMARQVAISNTTMVQVRFYRFADPEIPGERVDTPSTGYYRGLQYFQRNATGQWTPVGKFMRFPDGMMMNPAVRLSTILGEEPAKRTVTREQVQADKANQIELPRGVGFNYEYVYFHFLPSGGTDLSQTGVGPDSAGGLWHITVHAISDLARTNNGAVAPPDYACWALDPVSGTAKTYRPGVK